MSPSCLFESETLLYDYDLGCEVQDGSTQLEATQSLLEEGLQHKRGTGSLCGMLGLHLESYISIMYENIMLTVTNGVYLYLKEYCPCVSSSDACCS